MNITLQRFPEELQLLRDLGQSFNLALDLSDPQIGLLVGDGFAVSVVADREGVRYWYIDASEPPAIVQYALDFLVFRKRKVKKEPEQEAKDNFERVRLQLHGACLDLREHASDVLSGDRRWMNEYDFGTTSPAGDYRDNLLRIIWPKKFKN